MNNYFIKILMILTYIAAFTIIFDDWVTGLALGVGVGVSLLTDDNDKSCCK